MRRRAHRQLVLIDPERIERNKAYTKDIRARGDYRPEREEEMNDQARTSEADGVRDSAPR